MNIEVIPDCKYPNIDRVLEEITNILGLLQSILLKDTGIKKNWPNYKKFKISVIIVNNRQIKKLNNDFRNKNKKTDVITFPFDKGNKIMGSLAEIYISIDQAQKQAMEQQNSLLEELIILIIHGILHAFGYDHEKSPEDSKIMREKEIFLLKKINMQTISPLTQIL